ncbi:FAD/NAD(P)-binding protein, partial [Nocardia sp. NPDC050408]
MTEHSAESTSGARRAASSGPDAHTGPRPLRIAIVGAGPAGIYAADALMKSDAEVSIDLYERMP